MEEIYDKIIKKVSELAEGQSSSVLKIQVSILVRKGLNFMHREDFPEQLIEPTAEHLALKLEELKKKNLGEMGEIKKVVEGDTTYEYGSTTQQSVTDEVFLDLKSQFTHFRKVGTL